MALQISDDPTVWRMEFTREELLARARDYSLPEPLIEILSGNCPGTLQYRCEPVSPNSIWPLQDDFVPIWTCNGTSALAYEPSSGHYHYQHIEELPDGNPEILESYLHLCVWLLCQFIGSGRADGEIRVVAEFLQFGQLDLLVEAGDEQEFFRKLFPKN